MDFHISNVNKCRYIVGQHIHDDSDTDCTDEDDEDQHYVSAGSQSLRFILNLLETSGTASETHQILN